MPPQETDPGLDAGSNAAVRGFDLALGRVKATNDTSAVLGLLKLALLKVSWRAFGKWRQRRHSRTSLHDLSDRELLDIGVTREQIDHIAPHRAIDALKDSIRSRSVL